MREDYPESFPQIAGSAMEGPLRDEEAPKGGAVFWGFMCGLVWLLVILAWGTL